MRVINTIQNNEGFYLLEQAIVIVIIGILAALSIACYQPFREMPILGQAPRQDI